MLEGLLKIEEVLRVIIEAEGAVVPGEFYRTGRRYRRVDAKGDCEHKPAKRQCKETLLAKPCHPTLEATYELLMGPVRTREQLVKPIKTFFLQRPSTLSATVGINIPFLRPTLDFLFRVVCRQNRRLAGFLSKLNKYLTP
jgi:hypothetical protein